MSRIRFANQLRGVAALSVACSHLIGVYWALPGVVTAATFSPPQGGDTPGLFWLVGQPWFNLGPLGVAVFFLISGMVVPFSLEQHSRLSFLLARLLRIYPTYIAALLLQLAVLYGSATLWDRPFTYTSSMILANLTLTYDLVGLPSIDLVNWTLSVELKFYLLVILLAPAIRRGSVPVLLGTALCIFGANAAISAGLIGNIGALPSTPTYTFSSHSVCLGYMLIGTMFNFHLRGKIGTPAFLGAVASLAGLFVATWQVSVWRDQYPIVTVNYAYALVAFSLLYSARRFVPPNPVLDGMAAISFPFYLLHSLMGYVALKLLMVGGGVGYYPALLVSVLGMVLLSTILHVSIERPTQSLGRHLAKRPLQRFFIRPTQVMASTAPEPERAPLSSRTTPLPKR